jgi:CRP/FNR family transcriptional regulator, cyclic AMP receptor protein
MSSILDLLAEYEVRRFNAGQTVIKEGESTGFLYFLIEGAIEVRKDDVLLFATSQPGPVKEAIEIFLDHRDLNVRVQRRTQIE